jgi:hypothetical protein
MRGRGTGWARLCCIFALPHLLDREAYIALALSQLLEQGVWAFSLAAVLQPSDIRASSQACVSTKTTLCQLRFLVIIIISHRPRMERRTYFFSSTLRFDSTGRQRQGQEQAWKGRQTRCFAVAGFSPSLCLLMLNRILLPGLGKGAKRYHSPQCRTAFGGISFGIWYMAFALWDRP